MKMKTWEVFGNKECTYVLLTYFNEKTGNRYEINLQLNKEICILWYAIIINMMSRYIHMYLGMHTSFTKNWLMFFLKLKNCTQFVTKNTPLKQLNIYIILIFFSTLYFLYRIFFIIYAVTKVHETAWKLSRQNRKLTKIKR